MFALQVIAATNRADILDPALMRSGRLDRKIEFPHPTEDARAKILQIHSRKMNVAPDVNFEELARSSDDFNAAQLKAVSTDDTLKGAASCSVMTTCKHRGCDVQKPCWQHRWKSCCILPQVCVEAGMLALRRDAIEVNHEDFNEGIVAVQAKKKANLSYYA